MKPTRVDDISQLSDGELLEAVRAGSDDAYGVLYLRHNDAALRVARRKTPDRHLAEDAVNESFTAVLAAIRRGAGPVGVFSPYLFSSVTRAVYRYSGRSAREAPVNDTEILDGVMPDTSSVVQNFNNNAAREAFKQLPARWREVLWYVEIEEIPPRDAGPMLGLSPNATVALHRRAKAGLRLGYLQQHLAHKDSGECKDMSKDIPAYILGTLRKSRKTQLEDHLQSCEECGTVLMQIKDVGRLRGAILPALALLSLAEVFPDPAATVVTEPPAGQGKLRDILLTSFATVMVVSAATLAAVAFVAPTTDAATGLAPNPPSVQPNPTPSAPDHPPDSKAQFRMLNHNGLEAVATIETPVPLAELPESVVVKISPGSGSAILAAAPANPEEWACTVDSDGSAGCRSVAGRATTMRLTLTLTRPSCQTSTPLTVVISAPQMAPKQQSWPSPCTSAATAQ
ncbi:sigma-70 family RNA polymerase sigma factor [Paenarthrobacter sp. NPDC056912]|uniref:sigma-70 family RNA polymerase sigma factor n=1 Tax=Paenarthrobacter sp. NPDC056912 TaxID=3345965 RepID=UPI0036723828